MAACNICGKDAGYLYSICDACRTNGSQKSPASEVAKHVDRSQKKLGLPSILLRVIGVIVILIAAKFFGRVISDFFMQRNQPPVSEESLQDVADNINKTLPRQVDQFTRMDEAKAGPGNRITWYYTLTSVTSKTVDASRIQAANSQITTAACGTSSTRSILADGTTVTYIYRGLDGVEITRVDVKPGTCAP